MTKRILFLAANPPATDRLRIDEEIREITESLERSQNRSGYEFIHKGAVRFRDFRKALLEIKPQIVHFSGHGEGESGIILEDKDGKPQPVSAKVLSDLLSNVDGVECVVLNACYTNEHATEIARHIKCVISKQDSFLDPAAIAFSASYYEAIFAGYSYEKAFQIGCNTLQHEFPNEFAPILMVNEARSTTQEMESFDKVKTQTPNTIIDEEDEKNESEKSSPKTYLYRLKKTRTYLFGLIVDTIEYDFNVRLGGLFRTLPQLPQANSEHHVVVIEIRNRKPNVMAVLTEPGVSINPTSRDVGKLIFVVLSVKPHLIEIASPQEGYVLSDGNSIFADIELVFCINDVYKFWKSGRDPIANLEVHVVNEAKQYFSRLNSASLINKFDSSLDQDVQHSITLDKNGVRVDRVQAHITFTPQLQGFFQEHKYISLGTMGRLDVDTRIDLDKTFAPYKLRDLIMALDVRLLENFYVMPYKDAFRLVHDNFVKARQAYLERKNNEEIDRLSRLIKIAETRGLDETQISILKDKLKGCLLSLENSSLLDGSQSIQDYLQHLLGNRQTDS